METGKVTVKCIRCGTEFQTTLEKTKRLDTGQVRVLPAKTICSEECTMILLREAGYEV